MEENVCDTVRLKQNQIFLLRRERDSKRLHSLAEAFDSLIEGGYNHA